MPEKRTRILLVEDSRTDAHLIEKMLDGTDGMASVVEWVQTLSAGLESLCRGQIDLVVLDLNLSDSQGVDTFTRLSSKAPHVPIIVLTGTVDEKLAMQAIHLGAQDYLVKKEINSDLLLRAIRYAVERSRRLAGSEDAGPKQETVLLVEDSRTDARLITKMLTAAPGEGPVVESVNTLSAGLQRLSAGGIHIVLLDLNLPDSHGLDTVRTTTAHSPNLPIVVLTSSDDETLAAKAVGEGAQDYLVKGQVDSAHLLRAIRYAIERKRARQAIVASEARFHSMIRDNADGIVVVDRAGLVRYLNPAARSLFGTEAEQMLGQPFELPITAGETTEVQIAGSGDTPVVAAMRVAEMDWEGEPAHIVSLRDVTARKRAEEEVAKHRYHLEELVEHRTAELAATNQELESFSYSVSHDLRAPLRGLVGFSQALLEDYTDKLDEQGKHYLSRISAAGQRMSELIDDMLTLSHVTRSQMQRETVDLSAMAKQIAAVLREGQAERKVEFVIPDGLVVAADKRLLEAALENLLGNAWKFTGGHPTATIEFGVTDVQNEQVYFVRDDGAGFDMAYVDKLFGAFQRLHTEEEFPGTGIGLATVQRIVRRHGGRVWGEGEIEKGATFYFTLPAKAQPDETVPSESPSPKETVLVS